MPKKRNTGRRSIRPVMRILTEGSKTEINYVSGYITSYLNNLGYTSHDIIIEQPTDYSPAGLLKEAQKDKMDKDTVWIVFDCDQHPHKPETFKEAKASNVHIAYSSISFETWILLHFIYSTRAYRNSDEVIAVLNKYYLHGYSKAMNNLFQETTGPDNIRLATAISNAKRLNREVLRNNPDVPVYDLNPYTNIYELLEAINHFIQNKQ